MAEDFYVFRRAGREYFYVQFRDPRTGKLSAARSSRKTSEAAAIRWAKAELKKLEDIEGGKPSSQMRLADWARPFFSASCPYVGRKRVEGKTFSTHYISDYRRYLERFILGDPLADLSLSDIRRSDVLAWRGRVVAANGANRTSARVLAMLKLILNEAAYQELIDANPASRVSPPAYTHKERPAMSLEQVVKVLNPSYYTEPRYWAATFMAAYTGMRASEIRALQWDCIDFDKRLIHVRRAFKNDSKTVGLPKNGKERVVPMSGVLYNMLRAWEESILKRQSVKAPVTKRKEVPWLFAYSMNRPIGYGPWRAAFSAAARQAGVEGVTLHTLRHTLNTHLRGEVADIKLRESFGWSGSAIQDNYTHAEAMDYRDQADAIDRILGGQDGQATGSGRRDGKQGGGRLRIAQDGGRD